MTMSAVSIDAPTTHDAPESSRVRSRPAFAALDAVTTRQAFGPRHVLVRQGDPADRVFFVDRGRVKSVMRSVEGTNSALEVLGPGQLFGETALLDGDQHYATTVTGMDRGEVRVVGRAEFHAWLEQYPQEGAKLLAAMTQRITHLAERVDSSSLALPRRLARVLMLLLAELGAPEAEAVREPLNVSQQDLGEFVGAARESVNRQLRAWEREGIVELRRGRVVVTNFGALDDLSHKA